MVKRLQLLVKLDILLLEHVVHSPICPVCLFLQQTIYKYDSCLIHTEEIL